jgi:transposase InsO family protein
LTRSREFRDFEHIATFAPQPVPEDPVFDQLGEQSVGKPASCWDNIVAESFFATLKKERVQRRSWPLRRTSEMEIFDYIEIFCNRRRRHSRLGNISPGGYEERYCSVA